PWCEPERPARFPRADQHAGGAVDNAGTVPGMMHVIDVLKFGVTLPEHGIESQRADLFERRLQGAEGLHRGLRPHMLVMVKNGDTFVPDRDDRFREPAFRPRGVRAALTFKREGIDVATAEAVKGRQGIGADTLGGK